MRTIVATPRKWPGRNSPSRVDPTLGHVDPGLEALRVHLVSRRREHEVDADLPGEREVSFVVTGIAAQIGGIGELRGVDEEAHDDRVALGACGTQE